MVLGICSCRHQRYSELPTEEGVSEENQIFKDALLARGTAMVMEPEHNNILSVVALSEALERAA